MFKYHRTCYRDLTRSKSASTRSEQEIEEDNIRESWFAEIAEYVKDYVISEGNVLKMSTLAERYHNLQKEKNILIKGDINRLLKDCLKSSCHFFRRDREKQI